MTNKSLKKGFAFMAMGVMLFACNKQEEQTTKEATVESVLGSDLLNEIEKANEAQHQLVIQSIEELKAEGEIVTVDQINERIEENAVGFKSSGLNQEFLLTTSTEKLEKYAQKFSEKLISVGDNLSDDTQKEEFLSLLEKEKNTFIKDVLKDSSLNFVEKKDVITYVLLANSKIFTEITIIDDVAELTEGEVQTKFFGRIRNWFKKNWRKTKCIIGTSSLIGGAVVAAFNPLAGIAVASLSPWIKSCVEDRPYYINQPQIFR